MIATLFSIILAILIVLTSTADSALSLTSHTTLFISIGALFVLLTALINIGILTPLQKAEESSTPRVIDLFKKDTKFHIANAALLIFGLINFLFALSPPPLLKLNPTWFLAIWLVLLGISIDITLYLFKRSIEYFNPFSLISMFTKEAKRSIVTEKDNEVSQWVDALTEIANRAIDRRSIALCNDSTQEIQKVAQLFMESLKSIGHVPAQKNSDQTADQEQALGRDADEVSYILYYMYQRIEFLHEKALKNDLEPVCSNNISVVGKMIIYSAHFDLTFVSYGVFVLGKIAKKAQENGFNEVGIKATLTLLEIARTIIEEVPFNNFSDLKDPFLAIVTQLDEISKNAFQKDKSISIQLLIQPFLQLKSLLASPKIEGHQDTPTILAAIDRVLGEYAALEAIMKTMPAIPTVTE